VTNELAVNEPPARRRAPGRRKAKPGEEAEATHKSPPAEGVAHAELLQAVQELLQKHRALASDSGQEFSEVKSLVQSLRQAVEVNGRRLQELWQDSQETQTQLIQHTTQLNDLVQLDHAAVRDEDGVWDRLAAASEEFHQASERLLERMAEQTLRLEGKVDELSTRLGLLQQQLVLTVAALQENRASLQAVCSETQTAAAQLEGIQRECLDTAEMLQGTRQEIRAAREEVEATGDAAAEAAREMEESRLRMRDGYPAQAENGTAPPQPAPEHPAAANGNRSQLGVTVDANALIIGVSPESPAQKAGFQTGDKITAVDGQPIEKGTDLPKVIPNAESAGEFTIEVLRGEDTQLLTVRLPVEATPS
jgi:hypothetical protein